MPVLNWTSLLNLFECVSVQCILSANPHTRTSMNATDEKGLNRFSRVLHTRRKGDGQGENVFRVNVIILLDITKQNVTCCGETHYIKMLSVSFRDTQ
jgi:hypothetical protein